MGRQETKDKIRGAPDLKSEKIHVDEWDVDILVKAMTGHSRAWMLQQVTDEKGKIDNPKFQFYLMMECCFDVETGEKLFTPDDRWLMEEKAFVPIERICNLAMRLSGIGKRAEEVLAKNSNSATLNDTSTLN